jgi:hypothetical protein
LILEAVGGSEPNSMLDGVSTEAVRRAFNGAILAGLGGAARDLQVPVLVTYLLGDVPVQTLLAG